MADNKELAVVQVIHRKSGSTTYVLNTHPLGTVFHSKTGSFCCMNPTCSGVYVPGDPKYKGCEHTRCVVRYYETHGDAVDEGVVAVGAGTTTGASDDVLDDYA